jgi:hypothetical protein
MLRLTRRQFLATSTVASFAPVLGVAARPARGANAIGLTGAPPTPPLSVGYLEGSDALAGSWLEAPGRVVPVGSLGGYPSDLVSGWARVTVHGLVPGVRTDGFDSLMLDVDYRARENQPELRFYAWTLRGGRFGTVSGRSVFDIPVESGSTFLLTSRSAGIETTASRRLARPGILGTSLRPGAYLLAARPGIWDRPRIAPVVDDPAWADLASILVTVDPA